MTSTDITNTSTLRNVENTISQIPNQLISQQTIPRNYSNRVRKPARTYRTRSDSNRQPRVQPSARHHSRP